MPQLPLRGLVLSFALVLAACTVDTPPDDQADTETGDGDGDAQADACALVDGQTYASQEQLECGLTPSGVELCNWKISFDAGQYVWTYSDIEEAGDYGCAGLELVSAPEAEPLGSVSPDGALLTWDGVLYDRE